MSQREDVLVQLLRDSFEENAGCAPAADLTNPVVRRGRQVRARRRATGAVVGAAAVVAGVVVGVTLTSGAPQGRGPVATVPSPSATPSPPTPPGPPRLVRYPGQGVMVTRPDEVDQLRGTSQAFRDFVASYLPAGSPGCGPGSLIIRAWRSDGFAIGGVFECPGGYDAIFGAPDGTWRELIGSQARWTCHALRKWSVPSAIAGTKCDGPNGVQPYHQR